MNCPYRNISISLVRRSNVVLAAAAAVVVVVVVGDLLAACQWLLTYIA